MSATHDFYLARAAEARADADKATLANVRDRCLRSEEAWTAMAARIQRTDKLRLKSEAEKTARALEQEAAPGVSAPTNFIE